jgi:hypothetical protein
VFSLFLYRLLTHFFTSFFFSVGRFGSFVFFAVALCGDKNANVPNERWVFSLQRTSLYMARIVQIKQLFSDEARAEFLNFSYYLFY